MKGAPFRVHDALPDVCWILRDFLRNLGVPLSSPVLDTLQVCDEAASDEAPLAEAASAEGGEDKPCAQPAVQPAAQDQQAGFLEV